MGGRVKEESKGRGRGLEGEGLMKKRVMGRGWERGRGEVEGEGKEQGKGGEREGERELRREGGREEGVN